MAPGEDKEPFFTIRENTRRVWAEDDATTSQPDHESLENAYRRIYKVTEMPTPTATWNDGESLYTLLPTGTVLVDSYPGNSEIRELLERKTIVSEEIEDE